MGFGTGHHATTRLCLAALQAIEVQGRSLLDLGTGSGVLALAAVRLGAQTALGLDSDPDAILSARRNLTLNDPLPVTFEVGDLLSIPLPRADVVTANLTGALLVRAASQISHAVAPGGTLIVSGLLAHERQDALAAFGGFELVSEGEEEGWAALTMRLNHRRPTPV
jgi:ribosomal protein L11 methyltransferase